MQNPAFVMRLPTDFIRSGYARLRAYLGRDAPLEASETPPAESQHSDSAQFAQAQAFHQQGQLNEAEALYHALLLKHPKDFDLLHRLGMVQGQRGNFAAAIAFIEQALAVDPNSAAAHGSLGNCFKGLSRYKEALASYDRALALRPNDADTLSNRGATLRDLKRPEQALESYDRALAINPNHVLALDNRGTTLRELKRFEEALANHDRALSINPDYALAHYNRGLALTDLKQLEEARASFERALALDPSNSDTLISLGTTLDALRKYDEALVSFDRALTLNPHDPVAHSNRGTALRNLKRLDEALASYDRALALRPDSTETLIRRGATLSALNRHEEALASFDKALALEPDHAIAHYNRGIALGELKRYAEALNSCDSALKFAPDFAEALNHRGTVFYDLKQYEAALESYDHALRIKPDYADSLVNRTTVLSALNRHEEALESCDRALRIRPDDTEALNNRGAVLRNLGCHQEALASYDRALTIRPDYAEAYDGSGIALFELKRYEEALARYDHAIQISPDHADIRMNLSLFLLQLGNFARGWDEYEWRWQTTKFREMKINICAPVWQGQTLHGSLLVWNEQGVGDEIFFAGMLKDLEPYAASITVCVDHRLIPLFRRSFGNMQVISRQMLAPDAHFDAHIPLGSLGRFLRRSFSAFPDRAEPYLYACTHRARNLRASISQEKRLICGLSWFSKNPASGMDKSLRLQDLEPVLKLPGIDFVDLQYGDATEEQAALYAITGLCLKRITEIDNFNDIDGLAALIAACDIVVTVSNTTAHLAAALGKPVLLMLPFSRSLLWYWHTERTDSPWYPTVKPFRQSAIGDWGSVIARVGEELVRQRIGHCTVDVTEVLGDR